MSTPPEMANNIHDGTLERILGEIILPLQKVLEERNITKKPNKYVLICKPTSRRGLTHFQIGMIPTLPYWWISQRRATSMHMKLWNRNDIWDAFYVSIWWLHSSSLLQVLGDESATHKLPGCHPSLLGKDKVNTIHRFVVSKKCQKQFAMHGLNP